ncbi:hypothetical protein AOLI_G00235280 [Acnodon oligacanthus]
MLIDAVLLFISAKNLTKIRSSQKKMLGWKSLTVIGNIFPLIIGSVAAAVMYNEPAAKDCWLTNNVVFNKSVGLFMIFFLAANVIFFIAIFIAVAFSLKRLNSEILQRTQTQADRKLILSVLFKTMAQFFILGCPRALFVFGPKNLTLIYVLTLLDSQLGTFFFLAHCILNQEIRQQYRKWLHTFCLCKNPTTVNDTQRTEGNVSSTQ